MTTPVIALQAMQALAAGLGGYCLILWFQKSRKQAIIAFHLLAGLGAIEALIGFIHMSGLDADSPVRALGMTAAKWFGLAIFTGFAAPLHRQEKPAARQSFADSPCRQRAIGIFHHPLIRELGVSALKSASTAHPSSHPRRVVVLPTGTIGRATVRRAGTGWS